MNISITIKENIIANLLPVPQQVISKPCDMRLTDGMAIWIKNAEEKTDFAAKRLAELIEDELGLSLPVKYEESLPLYILTIRGVEKSATADLALIEKTDFGDEGYFIEVTEKACVLQASGAHGLLWAAMMFRQLLVRQNDSVVICGVSIYDRPHYSFRGFMIDAARCPVSLAAIKRIIRICSAFRLNHVVFREGDDEFNAVKYHTNKLGSENPYAFTMDEMAELIKYGEAYGITLVPEIESLGHSSAKAVQYPHLVEGGMLREYAGLCTRRRKAYLKPCDRESYDLLVSIYDEWLSILKGPYIHIGLDEVSVPDDLRKKHLMGLLDVLQKTSEKHGREITPIFWSDGAKMLPDEILPAVRCIWGYEEHGEVSFDNPHLIKQGIDVLFKPGCKQPVIMAGGSGSGYMPFTKGIYEAALSNLLCWARLGAGLDNCLGLLAVQWVGNTLDDWLPDFLAAADWGWNPPENTVDISAYIQRTFNHLSRLMDYSHPNDNEKNKPAWNGFWLNGKEFYRDIFTEIKDSR